MMPPTRIRNGKRRLCDLKLVSIFPKCFNILPRMCPKVATVITHMKKKKETNKSLLGRKVKYRPKVTRNYFWRRYKTNKEFKN